MKLSQFSLWKSLGRSPRMIRLTSLCPFVPNTIERGAAVWTLAKPILPNIRFLGKTSMYIHTPFGSDKELTQKRKRSFFYKNIVGVCHRTPPLLCRRHPPQIRFRLWPLHNEILFGEHESEIYPLYSQSAHHGFPVYLARIRYLRILGGLRSIDGWPFAWGISNSIC